MLIRRRAILIGVMLAAHVHVAASQQAPTARNPARIPIRDLSSPAVSVDTFKILSGLYEFADKRVVVNDVLGKRLVMYDSALVVSKVVADSTGKSALYPNSFMITSVFGYLGDSALFPDYNSQAFLVIEPGGKLGRALALPKPRDMQLMSQPYSGLPSFDNKGRFIYRAQAGRPGPAPATVPGALPRTRDTSTIVRADFDTRSVDTIASITLPTIDRSPVVWDDKGKASAKRVINPMPFPPDEWAVTSDGSLAILKPQDYHIDWVRSDGSRESTPKMPFDWRKLSDADKQARIDSAKHVIDSLAATPRGYGMIIAGRAGQIKPDTIFPTIEFIPIDQMPDYVPPFRAGTLRADRDNRLWVPPTTSTIAAGSNVVYDVINTKGEIVERVRVPADRLIAGFGPGGVVYLLKGDREKGFVLERRHILRPGVRAQ